MFFTIINLYPLLDRTHYYHISSYRLAVDFTINSCDVAAVIIYCVYLYLFTGLLEQLNDMNLKLEEIQKSLDMYLETKRQIFPRFYFLSNDDLLEILGQSKNPEAVQPHLKKCFDNIVKLKISKVCHTSILRYKISLLHDLLFLLLHMLFEYSYTDR